MSKLTLQLKRLGKKKIHLLEYELEKKPESLRELIEQCVKNEVKRYNEKRKDIKLLSFLSPIEIEEQSETGKIGFGDIENTELAKIDEAVSNAILAFEDGLFVVFIDDNEIKNLDKVLSMNQNATITFIRLTFLTGTYW